MTDQCFQFYVRLKPGVPFDEKSGVTNEWQPVADPMFLNHNTPEDILSDLRRSFEFFEFDYKVIQPPGATDCPYKIEADHTDWNEELKKLPKR